MATESRRRRGSLRRAWPVLGLLAGLGQVPVQAQEGLRLRPSVTLSLLATDNSALGTANAPQRDLVTELEGRLDLEWRSARTALRGHVAALAVHHRSGSQVDDVLPQADLVGQVTWVDRWLYTEAQAQVQQTAADPFAIVSDPALTTERVRTTRLRVAPYVSHEFSPTLSVLARLDRNWIRRDLSSTVLPITARDSDLSQHVLRLERRPVPLGAALEVTGTVTRNEGQTSPALDESAVRARATLAASPDLTLGAVAGRERARYGLVERRDSLYGLTLEYRPTERSRLAISAEHRYFGLGLDAQVTHRSPFVSLFVRAVRRPSASSEAGSLTGVGSTADLLDAMLTTREPDPALRAQRVRDLMSQLNLPSQIDGALDFLVESARLEQGVDLSAAFQGRLTTVTLSAFQRHLQALDGAVLPAAVDTQASRQQGLSLVVNRRLRPDLTGDVQLRWVQVRGLGARASEESDTRQARIGLSWQLAARSMLSLSLQRQILDSTATGVASSHATSIGAALLHRF